MILMASQQKTSPGFNNHSILENICPFGSRCHFKNVAGSWREKDYDQGVLHYKKLIRFDVLPRGSTFNQVYFTNNIFPDLKTANLTFRRRKTGSTFWVHMDDFMCHNGSKVTSKLRRTTFSECRTRLIHQIVARATFGSLGC
jgi:hypothetical protein